MNGRAYSVRVEGAKYGASFGSALANRDFIHDPTIRSCGRLSTDPQLALRHLFRSVPSVASPRRGTVPCSRGAMEARYGGTADHRRLSVDDTLAPFPAVRRVAVEPLESTDAPRPKS